MKKELSEDIVLWDWLGRMSFDDFHSLLEKDKLLRWKLKNHKKEWDFH